MNLKRTLIQASKNGFRSVVRPLVTAYESDCRDLEPSRWGLEHTPGKGLALSGLLLHDIVQRWGSPVHVVDAGRLRSNASRFLAVPPGCSAGCEVFYSYKTNPVPGVLRVLHGAGLGAEVISHYELWLARRLGVPPDRIIFNGPAKSEASIRDAIEHGVDTLNFNHREEIGVVARLAEQLGRKIRVGIRVNAGLGWSAQFGIPIAGDRALRAYAEALGSPFLEVVGMHAHRGGMIRRLDETERFVDAQLAFSDVLEERLGLTLEVMNFGGSLGLPTVHGIGPRDWTLSRNFHRHLPVPEADAALSIDKHVATIVERVEEHCRRRGRRRPRIILEPGRAMTGNTQMLLASVLTTKAADDAHYAVLDAGINLAESCRSEYHQLFPANRYGEPATEVYTLVGPICTPSDTLYPAARLPELRPGDSLAIMDSGAYFVPFSTSFSFPQPGIVLLDQGQVTQIRRAERFEDLVLYDEL